MSGSASATSTFRTICNGVAPERLRRLDVAIGHAGDRRDGVRVDERHAGDEDEHHLLRLVDAEPQDRQRNQRGDRQVAAEQRERRAGGLDDAPRSGEDAERHADQRRRGRSRSARASASRRCSASSARSFSRLGKLRTTSRRARQDDRRDRADPPAPRPSVASHQSSTTHGHRADADEPPRHRRRRRARSASSDGVRRRPASTWRPAPPPPGRP